MTPNWPPLEVTVSCGLSPSVAHLRRTVCNALPGLSADKATLYKYSLQTCSWFELKPGMRVEGKGKAVSLKRVENVFEPPYSLSEGDLICAFEVPAQAVMEAALAESVKRRKEAEEYKEKQIDEVAESVCTKRGRGEKAINGEREDGSESGVSKEAQVTSSSSSSVVSPPIIATASGNDSGALGQATSPATTTPAVSTGKAILTAVSRPEDKHLRGLRQQDRMDKKQGGGYRTMRHTKEIILSLGGDLDFSDESDSDREGVNIL